MKKRILLLSFIALSSIPAFAQNVPSYVPSNGLVGWWPFNGNASDESGNGNNGTVNGATLTNDRFGNANMAYSFDGVDDFIQTPNNALAGSFTISGWYKMPTYNINSLGANDFVFFCNHSGINDNNRNVLVGYRNFGLEYGHSTFIQNNSSNMTGYYGLNDIPIANVWHHIVFIFDNGVSVKMYLDNNLVYSNISVISNSSLPSLPFFFGVGIATQFNFFQGQLDDFGAWNRALTECEIQYLYHAQLGTQAISAGLDQSICAGDNVTLNGSGGSNYLWNNNVIDGQAFAPTQSNAYVVNGTDTLGCQGTDTVVVTVLENATSSLTQTALDSYTLNGQTYTQSGTYIQTVPAANGCDSIITLNLTLDFTGIDELGAGAKKLVKITDLNGKIIPRRKNTIMLFIYGDGTVERVVEMEE
jgi:hypothetical protein